MMITAVLVVVPIICAVICHMLANSRNRSGAKWAVLGGLFGPLAIVALFIMGEAKEGVR